MHVRVVLLRSCRNDLVITRCGQAIKSVLAAQMLECAEVLLHKWCIVLLVRCAVVLFGARSYGFWSTVRMGESTREQVGRCGDGERHIGAHVQTYKWGNGQTGKRASV